jgi:hypothetical protein
VLYPPAMREDRAQIVENSDVNAILFARYLDAALAHLFLPLCSAPSVLGAVSTILFRQDSTVLCEPKATLLNAIACGP